MSELLDKLAKLREVGIALDEKLWDEVIESVRSLESTAERIEAIAKVALRKGKPAIRVLLMDGSEFVSNAFCQFNGDPDFLKEQFERTVLEHYTHVFLLDMGDRT